MKRTILAATLGLAMVFGAMNVSAAEAVTFQEMPEDISDIDIDLQKPIDNIMLGAWVQQAELDEESTFPMYYYAPETSKICEKALLIVLDSGVKAEDFFAESGWKEVADAKNVSLVMVENLEGWKDDEKAVAKVAKAFATMKTRRYYDFSWDVLDLIGYGDGATVAMRYNMSAPDGFAAVLLFGGEAVPAEYMEEMAATDSTEQGKKLSEIPCPVWRFIDELTPEFEAEVAYWKNANNDTDYVYSSEYADYLYLPSSIYHGMQLENNNIAQTRVTVGKHVDGMGADFLMDVYEEYLWIYARHRGVGAQDLRYYVNPDDYGMDFYTAEVDGMVRSWYVYVPEKVKEAGTPAPLVVSMAGRGGSYNTFASLTQWPQIANERYFICAFPMASYGRQVNVGIGNVSMWNSNVDDVSFLRYMVEDIESKYPIDKGRIYANGQSMGSMMSTTISVNLADVFTATGSTCGALPAKVLESEYYSEDYECPVWVFFGEKDATVGSYKMSENQSVDTMINYYINRYGLTSVEDAATYRSGPFSHYIFYNEDKVPMFRYTVVDNKGHANIPTESLLIYDEFFSQFYKDENGKIHYQDEDTVLDIH